MDTVVVTLINDMTISGIIHDRVLLVFSLVTVTLFLPLLPAIFAVIVLILISVCKIFYIFAGSGFMGS